MNEIKYEEIELLKDKETELKVKLEDVVILSDSIRTLANEIYHLHKKIVDERS